MDHSGAAFAALRATAALGEGLFARGRAVAHKGPRQEAAIVTVPEIQISRQIVAVTKRAEAVGLV